MTVDLDVSARQLAFIEADAFEVLFGGAAGGGKSYGQLIDALLYALKYPGSKQLILRRTYPDLERSLILEHLKFYPRALYRYSATSHRGTFANGSVLEFGYCDMEKDVYRYQGAEYDVIRFDELTHFTESMYIYLISRVRGANDFPKAVKSSTNPGGVGHAWVKDRFIDIGKADIIHTLSTGTRLFLPSKIMDNKFLMDRDPEYLTRLENLDETNRRALRDGDWDIFEGQYFAEFDRDIHVCRPHGIPAHWRRYVTLDYGMDMLAALWVAVDEQGRAVVYKELYEGRDNGKGANKQGHIISEAARRMLEVNGDDDIYTWLAPPDLWNRRQDTGKSAAEIFFENGVALTKTGNDRVAGWLAVREFLALRPDEQGGTSPGLRIFDTCINLIRTLPAVQHDEKKPEDVANEPHELTHAPDALRGFCTYWSTAAQAPKKQTHDILRDDFSMKKPTAGPLGQGGKYHVI